MSKRPITLHLNPTEEDELIQALRDWQKNHRNEFWSSPRHRAVDETLYQLQRRPITPRPLNRGNTEAELRRQQMVAENPPHPSEGPCTCGNGIGCMLVPFDRW